MKKSNIILSLLVAGLWIGIIFPAGKTNSKIALIYPSLTKDILYKKNSSFKPTEEWELFFLSRNYDYEMLNDDDLDDINSDVSIIVIPSMEAVSAEMFDELEQLIEEGKGILLTGNFAVFDERGNKRTLINNDLPGFDISRVSKNAKLSVNHYLEGSTPFSDGLKPGQKILLSVNPELFYASGFSGSAHPEGSYLLSDNEFSGIVSNSISNGRLLWYGFSLSQLIDKNRDVLLSNSLKWLSSQPQTFINYWPGQYTFSLILYKNVEGPNSLDSTLIHPANPERLNYFISPFFLQKFPGQLKDISDSGNINIIWDDFLFSQMNSGEKTIRLKKIQTQINEISDQDYFGVSSYGEFKDSDTYRLLTETGYSFIFSSGYSDSFTFDYDTTNNLYHFYRPSYGAGIQQMSKSNINPGGIFYVDKDSAGRNVSSLLSAQNCWITTFSGLIDWAEKRKHLSISINHSESGNYEVNIKNDNASLIQDAGIWISVPHLNPTVVSIAGQEIKLTFDNLKKMYFLSLPPIRGYQEISFKVRVND